MLGINFPISEYYRTEIVDAQTISRKGGWWTAVLLIRDPKSKVPFVALYRWQHMEDGWKTRKRFTFRRRSDIDAIFKVVSQLGEKLTDGALEDGDE
jgi:hypothetical protein